MKLWPSSYHAKYEPDPSSDLAIIAPENLLHITLMLNFKTLGS